MGMWMLGGLNCTPTWTLLELSVPPRACFCMGVLNGVVVVFGGLNDSFSAFAGDDMNSHGGNADMVLSALTLVRLPSRHEHAIVTGPAPSPRALLSTGVLDSSLICAMGGVSNQE